MTGIIEESSEALEGGPRLVAPDPATTGGAGGSGGGGGF